MEETKADSSPAKHEHGNGCTCHVKPDDKPVEMDSRAFSRKIAAILAKQTGSQLRVMKGAAAKNIRFKNQTAMADEKMAGPNAKCPCGSGKKFKRCCMYK